MTTRRSFFQIVSAALAVTPALPAGAVTRVAPAREIQSMVAMARECEPLVSISISELVHSSMRMLGVLMPGETLADQEMKACLVVLRMLHPGLDPARELWMNADRWLWLRFDLAAEMAPEYAIYDFRQRCGWSYGGGVNVTDGSIPGLAEKWEEANRGLQPILPYRECA